MSQNICVMTETRLLLTLSHSMSGDNGSLPGVLCSDAFVVLYFLSLCTLKCAFKKCNWKCTNIYLWELLPHHGLTVTITDIKTNFKMTPS